MGGGGTKHAKSSEQGNLLYGFKYILQIKAHQCPYPGAPAATQILACASEKIVIPSAPPLLEKYLCMPCFRYFVPSSKFADPPYLFDFFFSSKGRLLEDFCNQLSENSSLTSGCSHWTQHPPRNGKDWTAVC